MDTWTPLRISTAVRAVAVATTPRDVSAQLMTGARECGIRVC